MSNESTNDFIIDEVGWHTKREGISKSKEEYFDLYWSLIDFLQKNDLTTKVLLKNRADISEKFHFKKSDLTKEGFLLIKNGYDRWSEKQDRKFEPENIKILEKALAKIRCASQK